MESMYKRVLICIHKDVLEKCDRDRGTIQNRSNYIQDAILEKTQKPNMRRILLEK